MSTHSSPPLSVEQNVLLPNSPIPSSRATSVTTRSRVSKLRLEMESRLDQMQQQQIDAFDHLEQQRQIESENTKAYLKLILDRLNTQITLPTERTSLDRRSADLEQPVLDETSINLQQTETQSNQPKSASTPPNNSLTDEQFYSTLYIDNKNKKYR